MDLIALPADARRCPARDLLIVVVQVYYPARGSLASFFWWARCFVSWGVVHPLWMRAVFCRGVGCPGRDGAARKNGKNITQDFPRRFPCSSEKSCFGKIPVHSINVLSFKTQRAILKVWIGR